MFGISNTPPNLLLPPQEPTQKSKKKRSDEEEGMQKKSKKQKVEKTEQELIYLVEKYLITESKNPDYNTLQASKLFLAIKDDTEKDRLAKGHYEKIAQGLELLWEATPQVFTHENITSLSSETFSHIAPKIRNKKLRSFFVTENIFTHKIINYDYKNIVFEFINYGVDVDYILNCIQNRLESHYKKFNDLFEQSPVQSNDSSFIKTLDTLFQDCAIIIDDYTDKRSAQVIALIKVFENTTQLSSTETLIEPEKNFNYHMQPVLANFKKLQLFIANKVLQTLKIDTISAEELVKSPSPRGSLLINACACGTTQLALVLIQQQCNVNAQAAYRRGPLYFACEKGLGEVVMALLNNGATYPNGGEDLLIMACRYGLGEVAVALFNKGARITTSRTLFEACSHNLTKVAGLLIDELLVQKNYEIYFQGYQYSKNGLNTLLQALLNARTKSIQEKASEKQPQLEELLCSTLKANQSQHLQLDITTISPENQEYITIQALQIAKLQEKGVQLFLAIPDSAIRDQIAEKCDVEVALALTKLWNHNQKSITEILSSRASMASFSTTTLLKILSYITTPSLRSFFFIKAFLEPDHLSSIVPQILDGGPIHIFYTHEVSIEGSSETFQISCLLILLWAYHDKTAVLAILQSQLHRDEGRAYLNRVRAPGTGRTPLLLAADFGFTDVVVELLQQEANPDFVDKEGKMALHLAIDQLHEETTAALLQKTNFTRADYMGYTPFQLLSIDATKDRAKSITFAKTFFPKFPAVLDYVEKNGFFNIMGHFLAYPEKLSQSPEANPLEFAFLFQDIQLTRKLAAQMTKEKFIQHASELAKKYPATLISVEDLWLDTQHRMHYQHLAQFVELPIPPKPKDSKIGDLMTVFNEIEFVNPTAIFNDKNETKDSLKVLLQKFIKRIEERDPVYSGIPKNPEEKEMFYRKLEDAICNSIVKINKELQKQGKEKEAAKLLAETFIIEMLKGSIICAPGARTASVIQYKKVVMGKPTTPKDCFAELEGELREVTLHEVTPTGPQSIHAYNLLMQKLGKQFAIPGHKNFSKENFTDIYIRTAIDDEHVIGAKKRFLANYSPSKMVQWIDNQLRTSQEVRDNFKEWAKSKISHTEIDQCVRPIIEEAITQGIPELLFQESFSKQSKETQDKIRKFCREKLIDFRPEITGEFPIKAIGAFALEQLLENFIAVSEDNGSYKINRDKIVQLLVELEAITHVSTRQHHL